jgi:DNA-binding response OmpR family regulator
MRRVSSAGSLPASTSPSASSERRTWNVLVYSHRPEVREAVVTAVGRRPAPDLGRIRYVEAAGVAEVLAACDAGEVDLAILDGEAQPTGGLGLARQLKDEITDCPPIVVSVRRADDRWLATWSRADAVLVHPLDPLTAAETVAEVLRGLEGGDGAPVRR